MGELALDQLSGILSDHQLFVGGDDPNLNLGILSGDLVLEATLLVGLSVDLHTQEAQVLTDSSTDQTVVLADTSGEGQNIQAVQSSSISADILGNFVCELLTGQSSICIAFISATSSAPRTFCFSVEGQVGDSGSD